jgi:alkylated DNA repair dioxygenase AlkB
MRRVAGGAFRMTLDGGRGSISTTRLRLDPGDLLVELGKSRVHFSLPGAAVTSAAMMLRALRS